MLNRRLVVTLLITNVVLIAAIVSLVGIGGIVLARNQTTQTVPQLISYQGSLSDDQGQPISGTKTITFSIFTTSTGGTALWQEVHAGVQIDNGIFSVQLGSITPFSDTLFSEPNRYLELEVDGVTLSPRQRFTSAPYALNADKLDGYDAADLIGNGGSVPSGAVVWFSYGSNPAGFTPKAKAVGLDMGLWEDLAAMPGTVSNVDCDVWTGSEVICWADYDTTNGAIYNVSNNSWRTMSTVNAPAAADGRSAIWSGSEMIVWGGRYYGTFITYTNIGGRYNPSTDSWTATGLNGAPSGRYHHGAVWTGDKMMIWGGMTTSGYTNTGALYDPVSDSWTPTSLTNAPQERQSPSLLWTGSKVIVWGGYTDNGWWATYYNTGALYDPVANTWTTMSTDGAPGLSYLTTGVWTGSEMVVFEGGQLYFYNPSTNKWRHTPLAPGGSAVASSVIVVNNLLWANGSIYDLNQEAWVGVNSTAEYSMENIFWTGDKFIGFRGGGIYSRTPDFIYPYVKD